MAQQMLQRCLFHLQVCSMKSQIVQRIFKNSLYVKARQRIKQHDSIMLLLTSGFSDNLGRRSLLFVRVSMRLQNKIYK
jgi:hypothetical protein